METTAVKIAPPSRRLRFVVLAGIIVVAVVVGWMACQSRLAKQLDREKALFESRGGILYFADEYDDSGDLVKSPIERNWIAHWSRTPLNINLHDVQEVRPLLDIAATYQGLWQIDLSGSNISDQDLGALSQMRELRHLLLNDTQVSDAVLTAISKLEHLETLDLTRTNITASGLAKWQAPPSLRTLMLIKCDIAEGSLSCLNKHPQLETLRLCDTKTDSKCLTELGTLPKLEELDLSGTQVDDECMPALLELHKVAILSLADTKVTARGLITLAQQQKKLTHLDVSKLPVTDEVIRGFRYAKLLQGFILSETVFSDEMSHYLFEMRLLNELAIDGTPVTAEGARRIVEHVRLRKLQVSEKLFSEEDRKYIHGLRKELVLEEVPVVAPSP